ncbi:hypothetical protein RN001_000495 [Aquatica leii]|uniref:CHK kinase-like domain-containing protein n=1 Tax=Aquatica leii TaxID=1421715 RepID=A0AAN7Q317_9COLE|nr:hypothetical protein RN001_000495 [Aquatica leii]
MSETSQLDILTTKVYKCLQDIITKLQINNCSVNIKKKVDYGENHLGVIVNVQISNEEGQVVNMVIKNAPKSAMYRDFFPIHNVFLRENFMYSKALKEFTKFQNNKNVKCTFGYFPKLYGAVLDLDNEAIILEDVNELEYKNMKREDPINYAHALLVVQELGKFHAISFAMKDQNKELFDELSQNTVDSHFTQFGQKGSVKNCYENWAKAASISLHKFQEKSIYDKINALKSDFYNILCDIVSPEICKDYAVICHGDVWVGNLLFKYLSNGQPESVCFLDWQISRYGSPVLDLSQFLFTCTDKSLRDQHYEDLIKAYYKSLCNFLQQLGSDPNTLFPEEVLQQHLRKFSVFGLIMAMQVTWLTLNVPKDDFYDIDAATTGDIDKVVDNFNKPNTEKYNLRIRDIILDYFKFGYDLQNVS